MLLSSSETRVTQQQLTFLALLLWLPVGDITLSVHLGQFSEKGYSEMMANSYSTKIVLIFLRTDY